MRKIFLLNSNDVSSGTKDITFVPSLYLHPYFLYASSEGSGEYAHFRRLTWAFVARQSDKNQNLVCRLKYVLA